jgi:hypothetical protein
MKNIMTIAAVAVAAGSLLTATGCTPAYTDAKKPGNTTLQATAGGALIGAGLGAAVDKKNRGRGALIGAGAGAITGAAIGNASEPRQ